MKNISALFMMLQILFFIIVPAVQAQEKNPVERDSIISAARDIIAQQTYCCLITIDSAGYPQARTINPFPPEADMSVWMATSSKTEKVREIKNNPRVCVYYANHQKATGYVSITGTAVLVDDMQEKLKRKREYWSQAFPDWNYLLLIKVVPEKLEVINYKRGMVGDTLRWSAPEVLFKKQ